MSWRWWGKRINSRMMVGSIFDLSASDQKAFWTGNPHPETYRLYLQQLGYSDKEQLFCRLNDDCRWVIAEDGYRHPEGKPMFGIPALEDRASLSQPGVLADCENLRDVKDYPWPDPKDIDFSEVLGRIREHSDKAVFTGLWSPFFHIVADLFGMESYFVKMYTHPLVAEAVTERVVDFYCEGNRRFFDVLGDEADIFFFGNDFGTQLDLLLSPENFRRFILPSFRRLIDIAKSYGKKVLLHSCGHIVDYLDDLAQTKICAVHPLQRTAGMDLREVKERYGDRWCIIGNIDSSRTLPYGTPEEVATEVKEAIDIAAPGGGYILASDHSLHDGIPLENIVEMFRVGAEYGRAFYSKK